MSRRLNPNAHLIAARKPMRQFKYIFFLFALGSMNQHAQARPSPAEKAEARAAFWGLFANNYLATVCAASLKDPQTCISTRIEQATRHAAVIQKLVGTRELEFMPALEAVKNSLQSGDLATVESFLVELEMRLIEQFASTAAPAVTPSLRVGREKYVEYCQGCHSDLSGAPGTLEGKLKHKPQPLNASWRNETQTPLGIYALLIHGVEGSEMLPMVETFDADELWSIAFFVASLPAGRQAQGITEEQLRWFKERRDEFSLMTLAQSSDDLLVSRLHSLGMPCSDCVSELQYLRNDWLAYANRLGDHAKDERKAREARGLTILIVLIAVTSIGFGFILSRRRRVK